MRTDKKNTKAKPKGRARESESLDVPLQLIIEDNADGIIIVDREGVVRFANPAAETLFGREAGQLTGKKFGFPVVKGESSEVTVIRPRGEKATVEMRAAEMRVGHAEWGGAPVFIASLRDVTERKKMEDALSNREQRFRTLVENLPQKIFLKDKNSVYVTCNENYARDLKIDPEEIAGKKDSEFYPRELAEKYRADDRRVMESGRMEEMEEQYIKDGQERWVHTVKTPVKDKKGVVTGVLGIFWDVTERKKIEEETKKHLHELEVFYKASVGREERIVELKKRVRELEAKLGKKTG